MIIITLDWIIVLLEIFIKQLLKVSSMSGYYVLLPINSYLLLFLLLLVLYSSQFFCVCLHAQYTSSSSFSSIQQQQKMWERRE